MEVLGDARTDHTAMGQEFTMDVGKTESDKFFTIDSKVGLVETGTGDYNVPMYYRAVRATGAYQDTARTAITDPLDPGYDPLLPSNGQDLGWIPGDALQATWIGAIYGTGPFVSPTKLSTTSFANLTTGERISVTDPASLSTW